jgi:hypothetical protein
MSLCVVNHYTMKAYRKTRSTAQRFLKSRRWMVANIYRPPPPLPAKCKAGFGEERNFLSSDRKGNAIPRLSRMQFSLIS